MLTAMGFRSAPTASVFDFMDVVEAFCHQLEKDSCFKSLGSLALTCRAISAIACRRLWAKPPSMLPLMLTLPKEIMRKHDTKIYAVDATIPHRHQTGTTLSFFRDRPGDSEGAWSRFDYYRAMIKDLSEVVNGWGFTMSMADMAEFVMRHRERTAPAEPLLPLLRKLAVPLYAYSSSPTLPPIPSVLLLLGVLNIEDLDFLNVTVAMVDRVPEENDPRVAWPEVLQTVDDGLGQFLQVCKPKMFYADIVDADIPRCLTQCLAHRRLRDVEIHVFRPTTTTQGLPHLRALLVSLSGLPALRTLKIEVPSMSADAATPAHDPIPQGFHALRSTSLPSADYLQAIPFNIRANLSDLRLTLATHGAQGSLLVECLEGCTRLEELHVEIVSEFTAVGLGSQGVPARFPWQSLTGMSRLTSIEISDIKGTLELPTDANIKLVSETCPGLEAVIWKAKPVASRTRAPATLQSLVALASCPLSVLDLPLRTENAIQGGDTGGGPRCLSLQLEIWYQQWSFTNIQLAPGQIRQVLDEIRPRHIPIREWIKLMNLPDSNVPKEHLQEIGQVWDTVLAEPNTARC